ncbi:MAG: hypothetical protein ABI608_03420 [Rhizomicrobium sp.]
MRESPISIGAWNLLARPVRGRINCALGVVILTPMFLSVAIWNGFPLIFFDTSAYVLEGLGHIFLIERAPVYAEFLFLAGGRFSLWPAVILQALISSYMILEVARAEVPRLTLAGLAGIGGALSLFTGIGWYVGQVEPDIFTPVVILGAYLLLFRSKRLGKAQLRWITGFTGLAVACHPSHLGLLSGFIICAVLLKSARRWKRHLPQPDLKRGAMGLVTALALIVAGNFVLTGKLFISKSGTVFLFARLMQDGIVQQVLNDSCPPRGETHWRLCAFKDRLPKSANAWLWGARSDFRAMGGFDNLSQQREEHRIMVESLKRYPVLHLRAAVTDSVVQFLQFKTGDGIEPQQWIAEPNFQRVIPAQIPAYREARQQRGLIRFKTLNLIHVPVGAMSVLGLLLLLQHAAVRRDWDGGLLAALVLLGLIGNAIICGTFSNPHDRYQSRIVWLPSLVLLLAVVRDRRALQPVPESGT